MARWILRDANGNLRGRIVTHGERTPTEEGSNPDGFTEEKVVRFGKIMAEPDGSPASERHRQRVLRRLERALGPEGLEMILEMSAARARKEGQ